MAEGNTRKSDLMDLIELQEIAASCTQCELHGGRNKPVFAKGNPSAKILLCGMVPAFEENRKGLPFVGQAGKLLDIILAETKLTLDDVYITNLVKCFLAPGKPLKDEWVDACLPYLVSQISLIQPLVILAIGGDASNALLANERKVAIGKLRDCVYDIGPRIKLVCTYHPSYLLRGGGINHKDYHKVLDDFWLATKVVTDLQGELS